jgi:hypothetical protein
MNRYAQLVLLALLTVLASVSLRRVAEAAIGSEWQPSFSMTGGTLSPVPPSHPGIGTSPTPPPKLRQVAIGTSPTPPPKLLQVAIGTSPTPPPKQR